MQGPQSAKGRQHTSFASIDEKPDHSDSPVQEVPGRKYISSFRKVSNECYAKVLSARSVALAGIKEEGATESAFKRIISIVNRILDLFQQIPNRVRNKKTLAQFQGDLKEMAKQCSRFRQTEGEIQQLRDSLASIPEKVLNRNGINKESLDETLYLIRSGVVSGADLPVSLDSYIDEGMKEQVRLLDELSKELSRIFGEMYRPVDIQEAVEKISQLRREDMISESGKQSLLKELDEWNQDRENRIVRDRHISPLANEIFFGELLEDSAVSRGVLFQINLIRSTAAQLAFSDYLLGRILKA